LAFIQLRVTDEPVSDVGMGGVVDINVALQGVESMPF
jgi:hypothetical protein